MKNSQPENVHRFEPAGRQAHATRVRPSGTARTQASLPGDHSVGVPPDPIPNSAVKPDRADGTIAQAMEE